VEEQNMTKAKLLDLMREGRATLEALLASVEDSQMVQPSTPEDWSVKDVLAHISSWDLFILKWLEADARGEKPDLPEPHMTEEDVDRLNARTYAEQRDRPLEAVRADFKSTYQAFLAKAEALSEGDLLDPNRFAWTKGDPLWRYFAINAHEHYDEHLDQIREAAQKPAR
jgi:hypothetical protein